MIKYILERGCYVELRNYTYFYSGVGSMTPYRKMYDIFNIKLVVNQQYKFNYPLGLPQNITVYS